MLEARGFNGANVSPAVPVESGADGRDGRRLDFDDDCHAAIGACSMEDLEVCYTPSEKADESRLNTVLSS